MLYFFLFVLIFLAVLFVALWYSSGQRYLQQEDKTAATNSALLFGFCNIVALVGFFVLLQQWWLITSPSTIFKKSFKFSAPEQTIFHDSSYWHIGETGYTYLTFRTDKTTVAKIIERRKLASRKEKSSHSEIEDAPSWWTPPNTSVLYYRMSNTQTASLTENEYLFYDEASKEAHYCLLKDD